MWKLLALPKLLCCGLPLLFMLIYLIFLPNLFMFLFVFCLLITLLLLLLFMVIIPLLPIELFGIVSNPRLQQVPGLSWGISIPFFLRMTNIMATLSPLMKSLISEHVVQRWTFMIWITLAVIILGLMGIFGLKSTVSLSIPCGALFNSDPMCISSLQELSLIAQELTFTLPAIVPQDAVPSSSFICGLITQNMQA
jgi:hypothetical protein